MSPSKIDLEDQQILDIRQGQDCFDLEEEITSGLRSEPRALPSLLLWDDRGLEFFDRLSQRPTYYPFHSEIEILSNYGSSIGATIPANGMLLELGCGAIRKTKLILSGIRKQQKPTHYVALDVSRESLEASLTELRKEFGDCEYITITGLLGTYDDCIAWLSGLANPMGSRSVTIMFLGNSFGNMKNLDEASIFLERFSTACRRAQLACNFLVSTDICQKPAKVMDAYDIQSPEMTAFLLNSLGAANLALGYEAFSLADWTISSQLDKCERTLRLYSTAKRELRVPLSPLGSHGDTVVVRKGGQIHLVDSAKWNEGDMLTISEQAGFRIQQRWKDHTGDYCVFLMAQEAEW